MVEKLHQRLGTKVGWIIQEGVKNLDLNHQPGRKRKGGGRPESIIAGSSLGDGNFSLEDIRPCDGGSVCLQPEFSE